MKTANSFARPFVAALMIASTLVSPLASSVAEAKPDGKAIFMTCMGCHGENGISVSPEWPNLAGQKKEYVKNQINAFKSGTRKNPLMEPMANTLSDEDAEAVATFISEMKIIVKVK